VLSESSFLLSFRGAAGDEESRSALENFQSEIPRGVYPERQSEILRSAQNDKRRARNDSLNEAFTQTPKEKAIFQFAMSQ
jgi:hypothetical protein